MRRPVRVVHRVTGYDRRTERLEVERDIPPALVATARELAGTPADPRAAAGAFRLDAASRAAVGALLGFPIGDRWDWFVEPVEDGAERGPPVSYELRLIPSG